MEKTTHDMDPGRQTASRLLWGLAGNADPIDLPADVRTNIAANLRNFATLLEQAPRHLAGFVFIGGERVQGDEEGIGVSFNVVGSSPSIAAAHVMFEQVGNEAGVRVGETCGSMREAVSHAARAAKRGEAVLLSPGCASFGLFVNEFDRGDQFRSAVLKLA